MHVVLKRRGITLRAIWDGVAKPATKLASHWARFTPNRSGINTDFAVKSTVALYAENVLSDTHSVTSETANLSTYHLSAPLRGGYDLSGEDFALTSMTTRTSYSDSFITGILHSAIQDNAASVDTTRTVERTMRYDGYHAANGLSPVEVVTFSPIVSSLNRNTLAVNATSLTTSSYHYTRLRLSYAWLQDDTSRLLTSNESSDGIYDLRATLPDSPLFEEDDPRQYDSLPPTDDKHMAIALSNDNTVPDFVTASRVLPTLHCVGRQLNNGDGQSHREGNPIVRVRPAHGIVTVLGHSYDRVMNLKT